MSPFPVLKNDRIIKAALGENVDKIPIWIMRQAGRYLPEFQELRSKYDFFTICQTPELACEVTIMPIKRFDLDAAIIFSDILVIPQALGMTVEMKPGIGPVLPNPLKTPSDIKNILKYPVDVNKELKYVFDAITLTRHKLDGKVPLIGFSGAPWTLMSYMIEGGGSTTMSKSKSWLYKYSSESTNLLNILTTCIIDYFVGQVKSGAQILQLFESHAGYLNKELFDRFAFSEIKNIAHGVKERLRIEGLPNVPMIIFAKGAHYALEELSTCGFDVVSIDWTISPIEARKQTKSSSITLQGNLDPCALYASKDDISKMARQMVNEFGKQKYIANLGHGIYPDVNPDNLNILINTIHEI